MKSGMIIGAVLACLFVAVFGGAPAPDSSADAEAEPSPTRLDSGTVEGLSRMAVLTGREAMQAVTIMRSYLGQLKNRGPDPLTPCFMKERSEEENSDTNADFVKRLVEDYRSALGYSNYIQIVKRFFSDSIEENPTCSYCLYLADVDRTVDTMTRSLANLVKYINQTAFLSVTSPTHDDQDLSQDDKGGLADEGSDSAHEEHCSDPCYDQQARVYARLLTFTSTYIPTDVQGYQQHYGN